VPLRIDAGALNVLATGAVNLANNPGGGTLTVNNLTQAVASFKLSSGADVVLNNISTTNGSINVTTNSGQLKVAATSNLSTNNGSITLQNNLGSIFIDQSAVLHGSSTTPGVGNVSLIIGAPGPLHSITQITNGAITSTGGGKILVGLNNPSLMAPQNFLNAFGRNVTLAGSAITLNGNVTITADPPPGAVGLVSVRAAQFGSQYLERQTATASSNGSEKIWSASSNEIVSSNHGGSAITMPAITDAGFNSLTTLAGMQIQHTTSMAAPLPSASSGSGELSSGTILFHADEKRVLSTPFGAVEADKDSLVLVVVTESGLSVYDLDDTHKSAVRIRVNEQIVELAPGRHATISSSKSFAKVNPIPLLAHRRAAIQTLDSGVGIFSTEFHLPSLIMGIKQLQTQQIPKSVMNHLVKTAAVVSTMSASQEQYQLFTPELTAELSFVP
jgi:hypothetical protein